MFKRSQGRRLAGGWLMFGRCAIFFLKQPAASDVTWKGEVYFIYFFYLNIYFFFKRATSSDWDGICATGRCFRCHFCLSSRRTLEKLQSKCFGGTSNLVFPGRLNQLAQFFWMFWISDRCWMCDIWPIYKGSWDGFGMFSVLRLWFLSLQSVAGSFRTKNLTVFWPALPRGLPRRSVGGLHPRIDGLNKTSRKNSQNLEGQESSNLGKVFFFGYVHFSRVGLVSHPK